MYSFIGQIKMFAGKVVPRYWAQCDGQLLSTQQYSALFSIIRTTYGGDGIHTFALPDFRGRAVVGQGNGPNLTNRLPGQKGGKESVTLTREQLGTHGHSATLIAENSLGTLQNPKGNMLGNTSSGNIYAPINTGNNKPMGAGSISVSPSGGPNPHNNMGPYTVVNYIICLRGEFPSRS